MNTSLNSNPFFKEKAFFLLKSTNFFVNSFFNFKKTDKNFFIARDENLGSKYLIIINALKNILINTHVHI